VRLWVLVFSLALAGCAAQPSRSSVPTPSLRVRGVVLDSNSGEPIRGAEACLSRDAHWDRNTVRCTPTPDGHGGADSLGRFELTAAGPGRYYLRARYIGFWSQIVRIQVPADSLVVLRLREREVIIESMTERRPN
jgi:Carboxypeptidase regulatory-like domain